jgi:hypothetical protein
VRLLISALACALAASAGPVDFGLAELNAAMSERKLKWKNKAELSTEAPETYRIEPYSYGGAHISGGDLRGLMYGLLEAAEQIRATGRLVKVHGVPATSLRGVRVVLNSRLEKAPEEFWRAYFQLLARNRFNRVHFAFTNFDPPYRLEKQLSQVAADYGIDFTLGIGGSISSDELVKLLAACPMIRSVAIEPASASREAVVTALRGAGRRVTLDADGLEAPADKALPVVRPSAQWPPSFEITPPFDPAEDHPAFYWVWGRLGYDPAAKPPKGANVDEYRLAGQVALLLATTPQTVSGRSDFVASHAEAVQNRLNRVASAKLTPIDVAERVDSAASRLDHSNLADLKTLAQMAHQEAHKIQALIDYEASPTKALPRPQLSYTIPENAPLGQAVQITLRMADPKIASNVRLHYRPLDTPQVETVIGQPPFPSMTFAIPAAELSPGERVQVYFEILNQEGSGWFEPDPFAGLPMPVVNVAVAPPSQ